MSFLKATAAVAVMAIVLVGSAGVGAAPSGIGSAIGVHGQWTVDVLNGDGSLASHTEFHNDLTASGEWVLGKLLTGTDTVDGWAVGLWEAACGHAGPCFVGEPNKDFTTIFGGNTDTLDSTNLVVSPTTNGLRLTGSVTASTGASIVGVSSYLQTVSSFSGTAGYEFTFASLANPIPVSGGQIVQVDVRISFNPLP